MNAKITKTGKKFYDVLGVINRGDERVPLLAGSPLRPNGIVVSSHLQLCCTHAPAVSGGDFVLEVDGEKWEIVIERAEDFTDDKNKKFTELTVWTHRKF